MNSHDLLTHLKTLANPEIATRSISFFKTGKGEYAEGDIFLGIRSAVLRSLSKKHSQLALTEVINILNSELHEARLLALFIMVGQFSKGNENTKTSIYKTYLKHTHCINNWDLVDSSAYQIVGTWLFNKERTKLYELAHSSLLWERRIAIIATLYFIKQGEFQDTLKLATLMLKDKEDLMHKAIGWMLREIGKRDRQILENYLYEHYKNMPRTMLRYAIEKFDENDRTAYLKGRV